MNAPRLSLLVGMILGIALAACGSPKPAPEPAPTNGLRDVRTLQSYRWTSELRADSSLFDQSQAPPALRSGPFVLKASVTGDRIAPDRSRSRTVVEPISTEATESITIGSQRWNRIGNGPWRVGAETFPAARAFFGGTATLSARAILEPDETSTLAQFRAEFPAMPYREESVATGPARHYTLRPDQVKALVADSALNPFPVLKTLPDVRVDIWVDEAAGVVVGLRAVGDTATQPEAFVLEIRVTEIEPAGLAIDPPR